MVCTDILSRGIDIEDVDWVVQYDPPKAANSFVHRCGRTARSGREGNAIIFLLPNEECYVNFLHINEQVPLIKLADKNEVNSNQSNEIIKKIQTKASLERYFDEKSYVFFLAQIQILLFYKK